MSAEIAKLYQYMNKYRDKNCIPYIECVAGIAGGSYGFAYGGGADYLCLPTDPEWGNKSTAGSKYHTSLLYGAEYEIHNEDGHFSTQNANYFNDEDVPCAVCRLANRPSKLMIPAKLSCPDSWTKEYSGFLMTNYDGNRGRTRYVCMDYAPEIIAGGASNVNGALFYGVEAKCGPLPCPQYKDGWDITCVVCSK